MFRQTQKWGILLGLAAATLLAPLSASAGTREDPQVRIESGYFTGAFSSARNSSDVSQYLVCGVFASDGYKNGYCYARDAAGTTAMCSTTSITLIEVIQSLKPDSYVNVYYDTTGTTSGTCTTIKLYNASGMPPKAH